MTQPSNPITLYGFGPGFGLPEISPYVVKAEVHLQMAGLPYVKQQAMPEDSPKGQLPYIEEQATKVADSHFIRRHIETIHGVDLDAGLDDLERAQAWALERMIENHFGWICGHARWILTDNFEKGPGQWFASLPEPMRGEMKAELYQAVEANMKAVGVLRHSEEEIVELGVRSLRALSAVLGDKAFLMGDRPTAVDGVAFGMLAGILTPFFDSALRREAEGFSALVAYVERMTRRFYPEHASAQAMAA